MAFALVLIGSLGIRLLLWLHRGGPLWFEEEVPVVWAQRLWGFERGHLDLNPHSALWPHLSAYVFFFVQILQYDVGRLTGEFHGLADFRAAMFLDPERLRASAMLGEIVFGLCAIVAAERLATRLAGPWMGIVVALVLALEPLHIRYSLVPGPDMLLTLFVTLSLLKAMDVFTRGRPRDSVLAGLCTGLGVAAKYSAVLVLVPLAIAHATGPARARGFRSAIYLGVAVGTFALCSPYSWLDFGKRAGELSAELSAFVHGPFGASVHPAALTYAFGVLPHDLGWPLTLLVALALIGSLVRPSRESMLVLAYVLPSALILGIASSVFERYLLPIVPLLLVLAVSRIPDARILSSPRRWFPVAALAGLLGLGWSCLRYVRESLDPDSRSLAREWIVTHLARGSVIALEPLGPDLPNVDDQMKMAALPGLSPQMRSRLDRAPVLSLAEIPMSVHDPDAASPFYDLRDFDGFDAIVVSSSVRGRYLAEPARFPVQADFYDGLDRFWNATYRTPHGAVRGPEILVYGPDSTRGAGLEAWWVERSHRHGAPARLPPDDRLAFVFARRAMCLTRAGRFAQASRQWPTALRWDRAPGEWWYAQGLALAGTGERGPAVHALREANRRDPQLVHAGLFAVELALMYGAVEDSRQALQEVMARDALSVADRRRADSLSREIAARRAGAQP